MFVLILASILALVYGYVGLRVIPSLPVSSLFKGTLWAALFFLWAATPLYFVLKINLGESSSKWTNWDWLAWVGYGGLGLISIGFSLLLMKDSAHLIYKLFHTGAHLAGWELPSSSRREFLSHSLNLGIAGFTVLLGGWGFFKATQLPGLKNIRLNLRHKHPDLKDLKIVQITDVHIGPTLKGNFLEAIVSRINALEPDIVAITGDLVDGSVRELKHHVAPLANLKPRIGAYFVTGNHEYYSGAKEWTAYLQDLGIRTLNNESERISFKGANVLIAGVTDYSTRHMASSHATDPRKAMAGGGDCHLKILLAHQPQSVYQGAEAGFDLQLSGHTHGGQYWPSTFLVRFFQPFVAGLYRHQNTWLYVSRGTGYWGPPLRLRSDSEITTFEFV